MSLDELFPEATSKGNIQNPEEWLILEENGTPYYLPLASLSEREKALLTLKKTTISASRVSENPWYQYLVQKKGSLPQEYKRLQMIYIDHQYRLPEELVDFLATLLPNMITEVSLSDNRTILLLDQSELIEVEELVKDVLPTLESDFGIKLTVFFGNSWSKLQANDLQAYFDEETKLFSDVTAGIVNWPMSVIRLRSADKNRLVELAETIRLAWRDYSDDSVDVVAYTGDTPHHTVTPIARKRRGLFELDIVLRDNHTTAEFPDGVYHPHADVQHIKKENIGLIEVMGLAILPPRLKDELSEVEKYLLDQYNEIADYHKDWADNIKKRTDITAKSVHNIVQEEVGKFFVRVLEDAGVYKRDEKGQVAFMRFVDSVGLE